MIQALNGKAQVVVSAPKQISSTLPSIVRSAARKPSVSVVRDYLVVQDINCVDADGNVFEHYDELLVAKDIERNNKGTLIKFIPYDAVVHFEGMGLFLPSFALSCNIIAALYQNRNNPEMNKILMQYKDRSDGVGWCAQNTIVDFGLEGVIHYPNKADFGGATEVNANRNRFVGYFSKAGLKDELLSKALLDPVKTHYVRQFTGLQDPSVLVEVGNYFGVSTKLWFPWMGRAGVGYKEKRAAWLGCGSGSLSFGTNDGLDYNNAARGVLLKAP